MLVKTEGIVIKSMDYGEGSKIITLFTRNKGKISLVARGAKKNRSRFNAATQIFSYGEYIYFPGHQMGTLNQGDIEHRFSDILLDIGKTAYAAYLAELIDKMTEPKEPNPYLFEQFLSGLEQINSGKDKEIIAHIFEMKILLTSGYRPRLHSCVICNSAEKLNLFSINHGGMLCAKHVAEEGIVLQNSTVKLLKLFESIDIKRLGNINVRDLTKSQLKLVMNLFFNQYIGINFKSKNFLKQLDKFGD